VALPRPPVASVFHRVKFGHSQKL